MPLMRTPTQIIKVVRVHFGKKKPKVWFLSGIENGS